MHRAGFQRPFSSKGRDLAGIGGAGRGAGEVYALENNSLAYYRAADGSPALRLGVGTAAISPNGKWVLLPSNHVSPKLPLQLEPNRTR